MSQEKLKCINCENHALYEFKCEINHPNYANKLTADLSNCFVKCKLHQSLDAAIELTDKLINNINNKEI